MDVFDLVMYGGGLDHVAIETATTLPEAMMHQTVGLTIFELVEKLRGMVTNP